MSRYDPITHNEELLKEIFKYNPIVAAQAKNNYIFEPDFWTGHTLIGNNPREDDYETKGEFIGEKGYVSFEKVAEEAQHTKGVIINFGDSSTSGWDSNSVNYSNPLFQYHTYSDMLRNVLKDDFTIINAGIPGHSSLQGSRRMEKILQRFDDMEVNVKYATIYFGNNDSVCNGNIQEKYALPDKKHSTLESIYNDSIHGAVDVVKKLYRVAVRKDTRTHIVPRVFVGDYKRNLRAMIQMLKTRRIIPLLIEPVTPLYWMPGRRIARAEEEIENMYLSSDSLATKHLWFARGVYQTSIEYIQDKNLQLKGLETALEMDRVCPRISKAYREALHSVSQMEAVCLIQLKIEHSQAFDEANFVDYTHPRGELNTIIANRIAETIRVYEQDENMRDTALVLREFLSIQDVEPSLYQQSLLNRIMNNTQLHDRSNNTQRIMPHLDTPPNMYTVRMPGGGNS